MERIDEVYRTLLDQNSIQAEHHAETLQQLGRMQGQIEAILAEAKQTNGRITAVENKVESLRNWRWYIMGGSTALVGVFELLKDKIKT
jgi:hypothetical protein